MKKLALMLVVLGVLLMSGCILDFGLSGSSNIDWSDNATEWRGQDGARFSVTLPPGGTSYSIWGTDIYTDDSSIGTAAVHCGLITFQSGGTVTIEIHPGQSSYQSSTRNGVTSSPWSAYYGSFTFVTD